MKKKVLQIIALLATALSQAQNNPYPILSVDSVQFVNMNRLMNPTDNTLPDYTTPSFKDTVYRDTVRFDGIVLTNPKLYGLSTSRKAAYIQRKGGGPWSSVLVMCEPSGTGTTLANLITETKFYDNFVVGYKVRVTGVIRNFQGETQVNLSRNSAFSENSVEQLSLTPDTLVVSTIQARDLMSGNPNTGWVQQKQTAEQWEGNYVQINNVSVYSVQTSGNRSFWSVIDDFGNVIDMRDMSAYYRRDDNEDTVPKIANTFQPPAIGTRLEYIRGIVTEYAASGVQRYGIAPVYPGDVKVCTACPPTIKFINRNPVIARSTDTLNITFEVTVGDTSLRTQVLYYKAPGSSTLDSVVMTTIPSFPNYYLGRINPVGTEGVLTFWVRAEDRKDRQSFFPDPLTLGRSIYVTSSGLNSIQQLQFSNTSSRSTIWDGDSLLNIDVRGVVTGRDFIAVTGTTNLITVQSGTGPNSAIFVQRNAAVTDSWNVGDSVQITRATVRENFNVTTLFSVLGNVVSSGNPLPAFETGLSTDSFALNRAAYARQWEGVLMRFDSVIVSNTNPDAPNDNDEFSFNKTSTGTGLRVDDMNAELRNLNTRLKLGMLMSFIQGPMYFSFGNFKLIPRGLSDLDLSKLDTLAPVITLLGNNPDTTYLNIAYTDPGATALDNIDGDISSQITVTGTVDTTTVGSYTLWYKVSDAWGNRDSMMRIVHVLDTTTNDTTTNGLSNNALAFAQLNLYPNPASSHLAISADFTQSVSVEVRIVDVLGKVYSTRTYTAAKLEETMDISQWPNGIYLVSFSTHNATRAVRVIINR
ncbi:MAG: immunoglobulin-like domain-containing protein [Bacteroidota bacterium]